MTKKRLAKNNLKACDINSHKKKTLPPAKKFKQNENFVGTVAG